MTKLALFAAVLLGLLASPTCTVAQEPFDRFDESHQQGSITTTIMEKVIVINTNGENCSGTSGVFRVVLTDIDGFELECRWQTRCTCFANVEITTAYSAEFFVTDFGGVNVVTSINPPEGG